MINLPDPHASPDAMLAYVQALADRADDLVGDLAHLWDDNSPYASKIREAMVATRLANVAIAALEDSLNEAGLADQINEMEPE